MSDHIVTSFDQELRELRNMIAEMGGYAEKSVADSVEALLKRDTQRAQAVIELDASIDRLQHARSRSAPSSSSPNASRWRSICARSSQLCASPTTWNGSGISAKTLPSARWRSTICSRTALSAVSTTWPVGARTSRRSWTPSPSDAEKALAAWSATGRSTTCTQPFPRTPDLHDGGSAQYRPLHPSAVHAPRTSSAWRPRHQRRRDRPFPGRGEADRRGPAEEATRQQLLDGERRRSRRT